jgi:molecular chaperone HscB
MTVTAHGLSRGTPPADPATVLTQTDFALFGIPEQFAQDQADLSARWISLQREAHPDKFASQGAADQRMAAQYAARINQAHQRLKDPLARAAYLCELRGAPIQAHDNTAMPADFLMQQMSWREALADAASEQDLDQVAQEPLAFGRSLLQKIEQSLDTDHNPSAAAQAVRQALFVEKFRQDLDAAYERLS